MSLIIPIVLLFAGKAYLHVAMGPLEARARKGNDLLYPKSALISRERGQLVDAWLAGAQRYEGLSPMTVSVLYGMRLLIVAVVVVVVVAQVTRILFP